MRTKLRGEVSGRQRSGAEASERHERAGGDVKGGKRAVGKDIAAGLMCIFYGLRKAVVGQGYTEKQAVIKMA